MRHDVAHAEHGQRTRAEIIAAARRLVAIHGLAATSLSDVLDAVAISKGAFYHHFRSKDDLAHAVLASVRADYQHTIFDTVLQAPQPPGLRWRLLLEQIVSLNQSGQWDNCLLMAKLAQETAQPIGGDLALQVTQTLDWIIGQWARALEIGQSAGTVRKDLPPRLMAEMILWTLYGEVTCREHQHDLAHLENTADAFVKLLSL